MIGPYELNRVHCVDCLEGMKKLPDGSVQTCVTSPPYYGLRDYGVSGQIGLEETPDAYVGRLVEVFREVRRVLRDDGTLWVNLGDSYAGTGDKGEYRDPKYASGRNGQAVAINKVCRGIKPKDLIGIPWRVAFALQADGWWLRQDIIWHKPNAMPESVTDRCTKSHEYVFLLSKSARYRYDGEAVAEVGVVAPRARKKYDGESFVDAKARGYDSCCGCSGSRNRRSVWTISTKSFHEAHFAVFPPEIPEVCILAGTKEGDIVLDPFMGSGTTGMVAIQNGRSTIGFELNPDYCQLANDRIEAAKKGMKLNEYRAGQLSLF